MHTPDTVIGWDIGGAHVKACVLQRGEAVDVMQWACPLWQGLTHLRQVFDEAAARWPDLGHAQHAVTMTGEMVDLFAHREEGVQRIAAIAAEALGRVAFFAAGPGEAEPSWCSAADAASQWPRIASANWRATAQHAAMVLQDHGGDGVLIDIGSTTTDLIAFRAGRVLSQSRSDADRLASGELVYHGVVRTPLCALTRRIAWRGQQLNVMNEFFATTADVYRLTSELDPAHDLHATADNAPKDAPSSRKRLARMIGLDERDAAIDEWHAFARAWRACQVSEIAGQLARVAEAAGLSAHAVVVAAGCGDFLVADVVADVVADSVNDVVTDAVAASPLRGAHRVDYGRAVARIAPSARADVAGWAQVCAPSVAVASLADRGLR